MVFGNGTYKKLGVKVEYIDYKMFYDAALILYDGAYVAERWADLKEFVSENEDKVFPVTKKNSSVWRYGRKECRKTV